VKIFLPPAKKHDFDSKRKDNGITLWKRAGCAGLLRFALGEMTGCKIRKLNGWTDWQGF
jgi:hypothetical protein